jgi:hypothetical protein
LLEIRLVGRTEAVLRDNQRQSVDSTWEGKDRERAKVKKGRTMARSCQELDSEVKSLGSDTR